MLIPRRQFEFTPASQQTNQYAISQLQKLLPKLSPEQVAAGKARVAAFAPAHESSD